MYNFTFEFADSDEANIKGLTSLYRWLREDSLARGQAEVKLVSESRPGELGAGEVLCVVLTQLTSVGGLAVAFATWRDSRAKTPSVRIRLGEYSIEVSDASAEQLTALLNALAAKDASKISPLKSPESSES